MRRLLRLAAVVAVAVLASACALVEDKVAVDYVPGGTPAPVAGAEGVILSVTAKDSRVQYADRVSTKKNGYGMEMARIVATNDVVALVRGAIEQELKAEGFGIAAGGLDVTIELQNFYNNFKSGFATGTAVAEVAFALKVRNPSGALLYAQFYSAVGEEGDVFLASGTNAKAALQKALTAAVRMVADDRALQAALLASRASQAPAGRRS